MPLTEFSRRAVRVTIAAVAVTVLSAAAASAGGIYKEHVYADSFGNLVVDSAAGYKRIVVGKGYLADELAANNRADGPKVVYFDRPQRAHERRAYHPRHRRSCHGVLLHGRSYMYGLPDNVVPELVACD